MCLFLLIYDFKDNSVPSPAGNGKEGQTTKTYGLNESMAMKSVPPRGIRGLWKCRGPLMRS